MLASGSIDATVRIWEASRPRGGDADSDSLDAETPNSTEPTYGP
ncbi:MAG: hypothetical protein ACHRXM_40570 [Isosphaerales bacterium]